MNENQYTEWLKRLERDRKKIVAEMMTKPFGDRVMSDGLESELDGIECELLNNPPVVGRTANRDPIYGGKGLREETPEESELVTGISPLSMKVIPQSEWPAYIEGKGGEKRLSVKPYVKHILNQKSVGSCGGEGLGGGIMAAENISGATPSKLNGYFLYHWSSGGRDQGSSLIANIRVAQERGIACEDEWPRSNGFRREPSPEAKHDALQHRLLGVELVQNWEEFGTGLLNTLPIYFGYPGHAIYAVTLISPVRLEYANSWDYSFGDQGFGTLHMNRIEWNYRVYVVLVVAENRQ